ncbi:PAS domain-containing sensor histidine kinase [Tepidicaulis sp. LMO-SS28]|uniref:PAS domain-containing sensor histidine kinase n=1 Tax=Tepidicaulis sp. LMO-SS28 TaxID=3447455 RepID=UPI003EE03679
MRESKLGKKTRTDTAQPGFFETLIANTGDVCTILDADGIMRFNSPAIAEMMGLPVDSGIGMHIGDIVHRDDRKRVEARVQECLATPHSTFMERFRLRHANGQWRWIEARARNLLHEPNVEGVLVISRDVNELVKLREHVGHLETVARIGLWRWEKGNSAPYWTQTLTRMLGYEKPPVFPDGRWNIHLIHPEDRENSVTQYEAAFKEKRPWYVRQRMLCADGTYRYFDIHTYFETGADNTVVSAAGVIADTTDMVGKEQALQRTEFQNQLFSEHAIDLIARHKPSGELIYISPSVKRMLGMTQEEALQFNIMHTVHPDDHQTFMDGIMRMAETGKGVTLTYRLPHKLGHYIWFETTIRPLMDEATGKLVEVFAISRDISERKRYEDELLRAREKAEAANRTKSQFLANMSHELRTPLNAIIGFSDIMRQELFGSVGHEKYKEYADLINDSGALLLELISDILDMSKIEAGKMQLRLKPASIRRLADSCLRIIGARAREKAQELTLDIDAETERHIFMCDERAVKQILLNLLSNAVKFTPEGGRITLRVTKEGSRLAIDVADTGIGIPKDHLPRLTRPFEQVASESHVAHEGSGLGLALVKSLAELHGGRVMIDSEEGKGTTVRVTLPFGRTGQLDFLEDMRA